MPNLKKIGFSIQSCIWISVRFKNVVDAAWAKTGLPVVLLVDEYDKPIIDTLDNEKLADSHRKKLKSFYDPN